MIHDIILPRLGRRERELLRPVGILHHDRAFRIFHADLAIERKVAFKQTENLRRRNPVRFVCHRTGCHFGHNRGAGIADDRAVIAAERLPVQRIKYQLRRLFDRNVRQLHGDRIVFKRTAVQCSGAVADVRKVCLAREIGDHSPAELILIVIRIAVHLFGDRIKPYHRRISAVSPFTAVRACVIGKRRAPKAGVFADDADVCCIAVKFPARSRSDRIARRISESCANVFARNTVADFRARNERRVIRSARKVHGERLARVAVCNGDRKFSYFDLFIPGRPISVFPPIICARI